jgi:hypothetical protein
VAKTPAARGIFRGLPYFGGLPVLVKSGPMIQGLEAEIVRSLFWVPGSADILGVPPSGPGASLRGALRAYCHRSNMEPCEPIGLRDTAGAEQRCIGFVNQRSYRG